jgi:nucleoporin POM152
MNGTPRLRPGAFPSTPRTEPVQRTSFGSSTSSNATPQRPTSKLPPVSKLRTASKPEPPPEPLISLAFVDAANQRLSVFFIYIGLLLWRLYDFYTLVYGGSNESLWLFLKWVSIDGVFLFALPALRIPWLEFSSPFLVVVLLGHVVLDGMIMFRVGVCLSLFR